MRGVLMRVWIICWLVLVWVMLWGDVSLANILSGVVVAGIVTVLLPLPKVPVQGRLHPVSLIRLVFTVVGYLVQSSVQVAWLAVRPGAPPLSAVLRAKVDVQSDLVLALATGIFTLIPGSMVLEIDRARRMLYMHVLDVGSQRAIDGFHRQVTQIEKLLVATFERPAEWRTAPEEERT